jgi:hypothetical protein
LKRRAKAGGRDSEDDKESVKDDGDETGSEASGMGGYERAGIEDGGMDAYENGGSADGSMGAYESEGSEAGATSDAFDNDEPTGDETMDDVPYAAPYLKRAAASTTPTKARPADDPEAPTSLRGGFIKKKPRKNSLRHASLSEDSDDDDVQDVEDVKTLLDFDETAMLTRPEGALLHKDVVFNDDLGTALRGTIVSEPTGRAGRGGAPKAKTYDLKTGPKARRRHVFEDGEYGDTWWIVGSVVTHCQDAAGEEVDSKKLMENVDDYDSMVDALSSSNERVRVGVAGKGHCMMLAAGLQKGELQGYSEVSMVNKQQNKKSLLFLLLLLLLLLMSFSKKKRDILLRFRD